MTQLSQGRASPAPDAYIQRFRDELNAGYQKHGDFSTLSLDSRRQLAEEIRAPWAAGGPAMAATHEECVGNYSTRVRIYHPTKGEVLPALVYVHGGGWTMFSLNTHDRLMREYAARANVAVVGVDYSLSPEARYPVALNEVVSVVDWLRENGEHHGIDGKRVAIGGDSAGANLSLATAIKTRDMGRNSLCGVLLNYGVYDCEPTESYQLYDGPEFMLTGEEMDGFWRNYLGDTSPDALTCPLRADLSDLPPTFMVIAECDVLFSENEAMAKRLTEAGVAAKARIYRGATHSFLEAMSIAPLANQALDDAAGWLIDIFGSALPSSFNANGSDHGE